MEAKERERLVVLLCKKLINDENTTIRKYGTCIWELTNPSLLKNYGEFHSIKVSELGIEFVYKIVQISIRTSPKVVENVFSLLREKEEECTDKVLENFSKSLDGNVKNLHCSK